LTGAQQEISYICRLPGVAVFDGLEQRLELVDLRGEARLRASAVGVLLPEVDQLVAKRRRQVRDRSRHGLGFKSVLRFFSTDKVLGAHELAPAFDDLGRLDSAA